MADFIDEGEDVMLDRIIEAMERAPVSPADSPQSPDGSSKPSDSGQPEKNRNTPSTILG